MKKNIFFIFLLFIIMSFSLIWGYTRNVGPQGETGNGISSIEKTATDGLVDTYTITFTDGTTATFTVTNGKDGLDGVQGEPGKDGNNGIDGTGIEKIEIDENENLLIYFTNGTSTVVKLPNHTHTFSEWIPFKSEDSYCESRLLYRICDVCNDIEWKQGSEDDHMWETVTTPPTYEEQGYDTNTCVICGKVEIDNYLDIYDRLRITSSDITWLQGGVDSTSGEINTTFTNNWYTDIKIPNGAEAVKLLTFKTFGKWGSAFLNSDGYISGYCDTENGQQWVTLEIPEGASILRYGYLQDWKVESDGKEMFEYIEFVGQNIEKEEQITEKLEAPQNRTHAFTVKVDISKITNEEDEKQATDYGYIMLPKNYSKDGEPVRLVMVCHGASSTLSSYQSFEVKTHSQTYWLEMGYAIMDMFACPPALGNGSELHYGNPVVLECYEKGYEYVMKRFNLKTDGIFVLGSSMGGLSSFQIVQSEKFPVLAQVANCPVIDLFKQAYCNPWTDVVYQREHISYYFGFAGIKPVFTGNKHIPSIDEVNYFVNNFEKIKTYSPIIARVISGDYLLITDNISSNAIVENKEEATLYAQLTATHPCPLLIIHNTDDSVVSYRYSVYFAEMLQRGGSEITLKLYDSGGHNAWDNGPSDKITNHFGEEIILSESRRLAISFFRKFESKTK